jgi:Interferon-induced transmembrane protein
VASASPPLPEPASPTGRVTSAPPPPPEIDAGSNPAPAPGWTPPDPAPSPSPGPAPAWTTSVGKRRSPFSRVPATWPRAVSGGEESTADAARTQISTTTPSNYLWQSFACLFLFLPSAVIAVLYSAQVNRRVQVGDMTGAIRASRLARTWCLVTVGVFTLAVLWLAAGGNAP